MDAENNIQLPNLDDNQQSINMPKKSPIRLRVLVSLLVILTIATVAIILIIRDNNKSIKTKNNNLVKTIKPVVSEEDLVKSKGSCELLPPKIVQDVLKLKELPSFLPPIGTNTTADALISSGCMYQLKPDNSLTSIMISINASNALSKEAYKTNTEKFNSLEKGQFTADNKHSYKTEDIDGIGNDAFRLVSDNSVTVLAKDGLYVYTVSISVIDDENSVSFKDTTVDLAKAVARIL